MFGNVKFNVEKWKYLSDITGREEFVITRAKINHLHLTHFYIISKKMKLKCVTNLK